MTTSPPPRERSRALRRRIRIAWWRGRYLVAAIAVALAVATAVHALRPPPPASLAVVVLTAAADAGGRVAPRDVELRLLPVAAVPAEALTRTSDAVGRRLVAGLSAGSVLTPGLLAGPGLAEHAPPGTVVVPVRLADAGVAELLRPGDVVDLLQASADAPGPAAVLASSALVLARGDEESGGSLLGGAETESPLLLVAVPRGAATLLSGAGTWAPLAAVLVAP